MDFAYWHFRCVDSGNWYSKKNEKFKAHQQSGILKRLNPVNSFKSFFSDTPKWLSIVAIVGCYYAVINFIIFFLSQHGTTVSKDGHFVLQDHGQLIKTLTEKGYHHYRANEIRGFSGHWIAFYGMAAAVLYPFKKEEP